MTQDEVIKLAHMTLRDYFAAMAMQGLVAAGNLHRPSVAKAAYDQADEMLKARGRDDLPLLP